MTKYIDRRLFDEVAGTDGQLLVVIRPNGEFEIAVPEGAEMREIPIPPEAQILTPPEGEVKPLLMSAETSVASVRSATYYEKCIDHVVYVCCNGYCRKKQPAQSC